MEAIGGGDAGASKKITAIGIAAATTSGPNTPISHLYITALRRLVDEILPVIP